MGGAYEHIYSRLKCYNARNCHCGHRCAQKWNLALLIAASLAWLYRSSAAPGQILNGGERGGGEAAFLQRQGSVRPLVAEGPQGDSGPLTL